MRSAGRSAFFRRVLHIHRSENVVLFEALQVNQCLRWPETLLDATPETLLEKALLDGTFSPPTGNGWILEFSKEIMNGI